MADETNIVEQILKWMANSTLIGTLFYGSLGGAANAWSVKSRRALLNQCALGALVAAGIGSGGDDLLLALLGVDPKSISGEMSSGTMAFAAGAFGPPAMKLVLIKIQRKQQIEEAKDEE